MQRPVCYILVMAGLEGSVLYMYTIRARLCLTIEAWAGFTQRL